MVAGDVRLPLKVAQRSTPLRQATDATILSTFDRKMAMPIIMRARVALCQDARYCFQYGNAKG